MWEGFKKTILWIFTTLAVVGVVNLENPCPDYAPYYCACSLVDIAEVKQVKMCYYENLGKPGCHPCPERLQDNVNCNSCSDDECPICSLQDFGAGKPNSSDIKQRVFLKFAPRHGVFYLQPLQDYPVSKTEGDEDYHIQTDVKDINNQTDIKEKFSGGVEKILEKYSQDSVSPRLLHIPEIPDATGVVSMKYQKQENPQTNVKYFQQSDFTNDEYFFAKNLDENIKNGHIISLNISSDEFQLKTLKDKCFFKRVPNSSGRENSSSTQIFHFQCSVTVSPNSDSNYMPSASVIKDDIHDCISHHSISVFNIHKNPELIRTNCDVSPPGATLLKSIKSVVGKENESSGMQFQEAVNSTLIEKIEFMIEITNLFQEQLNNSGKTHANNKNEYYSANGKLKIDIRLHLKKSSVKMQERSGSSQVLPEITERKIQNNVDKDTDEFINWSKVTQSTEKQPEIEVERSNLFDILIGEINKQQNVNADWLKSLKDEADVNAELNFYDETEKIFLGRRPEKTKSKLNFYSDKNEKNIPERYSDETNDSNKLNFDDETEKVLPEKYSDETDDNSELNFDDETEKIFLGRGAGEIKSKLNFYSDKNKKKLPERYSYETGDNNELKFDDETEKKLPERYSDETDDDFPDYQRERKTNLEDEMEQDFDKLNFFGINKNIQYSNSKHANDVSDIVRYILEDWLGMFNEEKDLDKETERENLFESPMYDTKKLLNGPEKNPTFFLMHLNITEPEDFSNLKRTFYNKRVYRDISPISLKPSSNISKNSNETVMMHHSTLKLITLNSDPAKKQQLYNFSDILWFRYRKYALIPNMNKKLQPKRLKKSEMFNMLNVSISNLKKIKMYNPKCETCSVIYKMMVDSGFKNDPKLMEDGNSSVVVLMDKPKFVHYRNKSKFPFENRKMFKQLTKRVNFYTIRMNIDLLFLSSDEYNRLSLGNASNTKLLRNTPWRDLRKTVAFRIPENFNSLSKILNLTRSFDRKNLKSLFDNPINQGQLIEELQKIVFAVLSKMQEQHKTNVGQQNSDRSPSKISRHEEQEKKDKKSSPRDRKESVVEEQKEVEDTPSRDGESDEDFEWESNVVIHDENTTRNVEKNHSKELDEDFELESDVSIYKENTTRNSEEKHFDESKSIWKKTRGKENIDCLKNVFNNFIDSLVELIFKPENKFKADKCECKISASDREFNKLHQVKAKKTGEKENIDCLKNDCNKILDSLDELIFKQVYKFIVDKSECKISASDSEFNKLHQVKAKNNAEHKKTKGTDKVNYQKLTNYNSSIPSNEKESLIDYYENMFLFGNSSNDKFEQVKNGIPASESQNINDSQQEGKTELKIMLLKKLIELTQNITNRSDSIFFSDNAFTEKSGTNTNRTFETLKQENEALVGKIKQKQSPEKDYETIKETHAIFDLKNTLNTTASQSENELQEIRDRNRYFNRLTRDRRSLSNSDDISDSDGPIYHIRITDDMWHPNPMKWGRKKRQVSGLPQNHWCTIMSMRRNGDIDCTIWTYKKVCKYRCHTGYTYNGNNALESTCARNGNRWSQDMNKPCTPSFPIKFRAAPPVPSMGPKTPIPLQKPSPDKSKKMPDDEYDEYYDDYDYS